MKIASSFAFLASLLTASALVTPAAANVSPSAPTLKISGNTIVTAYAIDQKVTNNGKSEAHHLDNAVSDLYFLVIGRATNGIEYKMKINLQAFSAADPIVNQNYIEFNGKFGTVQAGNVVGPEDSMIEDGLAVMGGTGGADGAYHNVYNLSAFAYRGNDNIGDTGYATKIVYYTPELYNFRLGVAYTANTAHRGEDKLNNQSPSSSSRPGNRTLFPTSDKKNEPFGTRSFAFGLSYKKEVGQWGFNVNGAYITDKSYIFDANAGSRARMRNTSAFQLGTIIGYRMNNGHLVQVGGGYLDNGKSRLPRVANQPAGIIGEDYGFLNTGNAGKAWNAGVGYTMGAYKISGSYQGSDRKVLNNLALGKVKARNHVYAAALDVIPVQGLKFFGEVDYVRSKTTDGALDTGRTGINLTETKTLNAKNHGTIFMLGSKVSF